MQSVTGHTPEPDTPRSCIATSPGDGSSCGCGCGHDGDSMAISRRDRALIMGIALTVFVALFHNQLGYVSAWRAGSLAEKNQIEEGLSVARRGTLLSPGNAKVWDVMGFLLDRSGDHAASETAYLKVIDLDPESAASFWRFIGIGRLKYKRFDEAIEPFQKSLALDDSDQLTWRSLAIAQMRSGRLADAELTWGEYARRFPDSDGEEHVREIRERLEAGS